MNECQNYDDFISTVSHELRTPLTSIRGFSQTMLSSWDKLDDESKKKFLKIIEEQSNRLINLVENMLSVTKLHSGSDKIVYKEVGVKPVVDTVVQIVKNQYKDKTFLVDISKDIPTVCVDKDKFQQILTNIIENAGKYGLENSQVKISANSCENCKFVTIKISNLGIGIEKTDYEKIFTKFSRIDNPLTRKVQGSGLGLYITKNLVEKMGGKISVISTKFDSTHLVTFEIALPVCDIEKQAREKCNQ